jgi:hypothetical protein
LILFNLQITKFWSTAPPRNFSLSVILTLHPTPEFLDQAQNLTHLSGSIYGFQLGFQGDAAQEELNVTFDLGSGGFLNMSLCKQQGFLGKWLHPYHGRISWRIQGVGYGIVRSAYTLPLYAQWAPKSRPA